MLRPFITSYICFSYKVKVVVALLKVYLFHSSVQLLKLYNCY